MRIRGRKRTSPLSLVGLMLAVLGTVLSLFAGPARAAEYWVNQNDRDIYFTVTSPETIVLRTYAQQYGIDSMLWLYNPSGDLVAQNDDHYGLDSYISYAAQPGIYRMRAGVCCGDPNRWYGNSYRVEATAAVTDGPSSTTTTTTSTSTTTTTIAPYLGAPRNVSVVNSGNGVIVSWDPPDSGNRDPERYAVMWSCDGCQGRSVSSVSTSVSIPYTSIDDSGPIGQNFTFRVRSDNDTLSLYSAWTEGETLRVGPAVPSSSHSGGGCGPYYSRLVLASANGGAVWGSNPYTDDSDFSVAAVASGIAEPGEWVVIEPYWVDNYQFYPGSTRNGVTTSEWGSSWCGYYIKAAGTPTPTSTTTTSTTTTSTTTTLPPTTTTSTSTTTTEPATTTTTTSSSIPETPTTSQPEPTTSLPPETTPETVPPTTEPSTTTTSTVPPTRNVTTTTRPPTTTTEVPLAPTTLPPTTTTSLPEPAPEPEDEEEAPSVKDDPKVLETLTDMGFSEEEVEAIAENADDLVDQGFSPEQAVAIAAEAQSIVQEGFSEEDALRVAVEDASPLAQTLGKSTRVKAQIGPISLKIVVTPTERRSIIAVGATMVFGGATILSGSSVSSQPSATRRET